MSQWKRLFYYLMINVVVSACTVLIVLTVWERRFSPGELVIMPTAEQRAQASLPAVSGTPGTGVAQLVPATTSTPTPGEDLLKNVEEYQVQFGDTLGLIADQFEVSIEDLLRVNQINDPNELSVGMVIYVPLPPDKIPTETPTLTYTSVPMSSTGPLPEARVDIVSVIGAGDLATEKIWMCRTGAGDLSLAGWRLRDENDNTFQFPQLELYEGGCINVWTTSGVSNVVDLYWGLQSPVWSQGERVTLLDGEGKEHASYIVP